MHSISKFKVFQLKETPKETFEGGVAIDNCEKAFREKFSITQQISTLLASSGGITEGQLVYSIFVDGKLWGYSNGKLELGIVTTNLPTDNSKEKNIDKILADKQLNTEE